MANDIFTESGSIVDIIGKRIFKGQVIIENGVIKDIIEKEVTENQFIIPGFIDAHIHIESSLLPPHEFARLASIHGTVGAICDPHEIANVAGIEGINFMISNAAVAGIHFLFGAPPCVPATIFETSGAEITAENIKELLTSGKCSFLSEVMNYEGVIAGEKSILEKIAIAHKLNLPVDGHAPALTGKALRTYVEAGISTDHESTTLEEALEKLKLGMKIIIREGSAAKNFDTLIPLIAQYPDHIMFCTDDCSPHDLREGHINQLVKRAIKTGYDLFDVLRAASLNPVLHYKIPVGVLTKGQSADFLIVDNLKDFEVLKTVVKGKVVATAQKAEILHSKTEKINNFNTNYINADQIAIPARGERIKVICAEDKQLITRSETRYARSKDNFLISDPSHDLLKLVVVCRYDNTPPAVAFVSGFGIKSGAIATSVSHDSHNIIAVGADDISIKRAINLVIKEKGGLGYVFEDEASILPLPVGGLMSDDTFENVSDKYRNLLDMVKRYMDCKLTSPFMTLSFLSLEVIPELKLSNKGLFEVNEQKFTDLYVD